MNNRDIQFIAITAIPILIAIIVVAIGQVAFGQTINVTDGDIELPPLPPLTLNSLFGDLTSTVIFLVLLVAVTFRQSSEFIEKWIKGEIEFFDRKYLAYAFIALTSSIPLGIGLFGQAAKVFLVAYGTWGFVGGLVMVAIYGYGWQHLTNKTASFIGHFISPAAKGQTQSESPDKTEP